MKINKKILLLLIIYSGIHGQIRIPGAFFGLNYWNTDYTNAPFTGSPTVFSPTIINTYISSTGAKMMRVGGTAYNIDAPFQYPHTGSGTSAIVVPAGYVKIVDDVRALGFEPMIQVPFEDRSKTRGMEEQAAWVAEIVREVNVVHKRNVKYWIIGNEPTTNQLYGDPPSSTQIDRVRDYMKKYSVEMKKIDPTISIIGPELSSASDNYLNQLFSDPTNTANPSISGTIPSTFQGVPTGTAVSGKNFIDFASFHSYPGWGSVFTTTANTNPPRQRYIDAGYSLMTDFQNAYSNTLSASQNTHMALMLDEFNMSSAATETDASATSSVSYTSDAYNGNTFLAGQLLVDMMAAMLSATNTATTTPYSNCNLWSVSENQHKTIIDGSTRKPTYWHYWMMSKFFYGDFYKNVAPVPASGNVERAIKAYACYTSDYIAVLVMNQMTQTSTNTAVYNPSPSQTYSFVINFDGTTPTFTPAAHFSYSMGLTGTSYTGSIANESSYLYFFNCTGNFSSRIELKQSDIAANPSGYDIMTHTVNTIPTVPTITVSNANCVGGTATLTAPSPSVTWYAGPDFGTVISTSNIIHPTAPGIYYAKVNGTCNQYWTSAVVSQTSPILSRNSEVVENCGTGTVALDVGNGGYTYTWSPSTGLSTTTAYATVANPTSDQVYSVTATSGGCSTTETINLLTCNTSAANQDLWLKDNPSDLGVEPNTTYTLDNNVFWMSPDIWINQTATTQTTEDNGNGVFDSSSDPSYIHVRVRNNGSSAASGRLSLYWAKASPFATWSANWLNAVATTSAPNTATATGDQIGTPITITVAAYGTTYITIPWVVPDPNNFIGISPSDIQHFCLQARLETGCGLTSNAYDILGNNNIAQKNITIINSGLRPRGSSVGLIIRNTNTVTTTTKLKVSAYSNTLGKSVFDYATPYLELNSDLYSQWKTGGSAGSNVVDLGSNLIKMTANNATLEKIDLTSLQETALNIKFTFTSQASTSYSFDADMIQYSTGSVDVLLGGEHFLIEPPVCPTITLISSSVNIDLGCSATLEVSSPDDGAEYTWYDSSTGESLATTYSVSVSPTVTSYYYVEEALNGCVQQATAAVNVSTVDCKGGGRMAAPSKTLATLAGEDVTFGVRPNPTTDQATITYDVEGIQKAEVTISNSYGGILTKISLDPNKKKITLSCSDYKNGLYYVTLTTGDKITKTVKLIIMK